MFGSTKGTGVVDFGVVHLKICELEPPEPGLHANVGSPTSKCGFSVSGCRKEGQTHTDPTHRAPTQALWVFPNWCPCEVALVNLR